MATRKRVSYSLVTPTTTVPALGLPPPQHDQIGRAAPTYRVFPAPRQAATTISEAPKHPTHCLGVTALALDTTTILHGQKAPRGILYTGGRDGLVASWEQGVPMKRAERSTDEEYVRWERIGVVDEEEGEEEDSEFGFIGGHARGGGDAVANRGRDDESVKWTVDREAIQGGSLGVSTIESSTVNLLTLSSQQPKFRQSLQTHTDWVNDLLLVNQGQTGKSLYLALLMFPLTFSFPLHSHHRVLRSIDSSVAAPFARETRPARIGRRSQGLRQVSRICVSLLLSIS